MKFTASLLALALLLAGSADAAHVQRKHGRRGPSQIYTPTPTPTPAPSSSAVPPPPSQSSAAAPAPSSTGTTIKRGLSFNDASLTSDFNSQQVSWAYNWAPSFEGNLPTGVEFFPMLWGADSQHTDGWSDTATAAIANGATYLLGFNEPDLSAQSNLTPEQAASAWMQFMQPFAGKAKLIAPAITNGGAPMGTAWLDSFIAACPDCTIDGYAIHIYDSATNVQYYQNYISDAVTKYGKEILVTEFGATGSASQQQEFLQQMVPFLDGLDGVSHYAWFMTAVGNLVNSDSSLSSLGETYVSS
ncbi:hypothetical protein CERSUDRAFT_118787 [Gelatoporia subvermispora B]|uniref:Asl1-like glycosyl hydrolase catalytic domain-containing protein n=1 Tax=Ceriporiopsis subvermispora (strain B) TaxID=914234 RepID=M2PAD6_CERS8|nr:hypothetical protein CERSUDRAFT_118787 [Gelatoporia subvermispora B]